MTPAVVVHHGRHLSGRGWSDADVHAVLGGNFRRVAKQAWVDAT